MIPATRAFTLRSEIVDGTFAIWVTVPPGYGADDSALPVVYALDGNTQLAVTAPTGALMMLHETSPIRPFVQVTIGYLGDDARNFLRVRNRDLVPPGEPFAHQMAAHLRPRVDRGVVSEDQYADILADLRVAAGDRFLEFIEYELHPRIVDRWRVDVQDIGLFGYSYGGLFSMYAFASGSPLFTMIGASSPGILSPESEVFRHYDRRVAEGDKTSPPRLHLTINDSETTSPFPLYRDLSQQYLALVDRIRRAPLPGLHATAEVIQGETHGTGIVDAYRSFVRSCYAVRGHDPSTEIAWAS
ncbi:alpha/beta hydrolase [Rhodococcus opacus]|uniref:alpha/beta hydrolase n=1 Tax=Rhodococcus opacus TaxID=37919 RepID=UPI001C46CAA6|nr:hypothetical protein [Rhodococcus opacus]MBV6759842.1 hypothetical protein [Rhodococcus opacus]